MDVPALQGTQNQNSELPNFTKKELREIYALGEAMVLFSFSKDIVATEAYADWEAYLSDFKQQPKTNM